MRNRFAFTAIGLAALAVACAGCGSNEGVQNPSLAGSWTLVSYTPPGGAEESCAGASGTTTSTSSYAPCSDGETLTIAQSGTFSTAVNGTVNVTGTYTEYGGDSITTIFTAINTTSPTYSENSSFTLDGSQLTLKLVSSTYSVDQPYIGSVYTYRLSSTGSTGT